MSKKKKSRAYESALEKDEMDAFLFDTVLDAYPAIDDMANNEEAFHGISDVFSSLYQNFPAAKENAPEIENYVMKQMMEMREWQDFRDHTRLDDVGSAIGTAQLGDAVMREYYDLLQKAEERQQQQQQSGQGGTPPPDGQPQDGQGEGQGGGSPGGDQQPGQAGEMQSIEEILGKEEAARMRGRIRQALQDSQEKVEDYQEAMAAWGNDKGEIEKMDFKERLNVAETLTQNPKFKKISEMMGRFKNLANAQMATRYTHGNDEIVDISQGDDLENILPSELLKMKRTPTLFYKDYLEEGLQQYNLKGVEQQGRGPMIVCLDISSSMRGSRFEWAMAVTMALCHIAEKQKRAFSFISFNSQVQGTFSASGRLSFQEKMEIMSTNCSGGTYFDAPMREAMHVRKNVPGMDKADIVFITDGDQRLNICNEVNQFKQDTNTRIYGIGMEGRGGLNDFCDHIALVHGNGEVDEIKDLIKEAIKEK